MNNGKIRGHILEIIGFALLVLSVCFAVLLYISQIEQVHLWYAGIQLQLLELENTIAKIENRWLFLVVIFLMYSLKSVFPIISTAVICVMTGTVFPVYIAFPVNIAGLIINFSIKYFIGRRFGGGNAQKLINRNSGVRNLMEKDGRGNPWLLIALRVVPSFPINSVSQLYGQMKFRYIYFLLLSFLGYAPKLITYTFIGRNVFDPLSPAFLTPIIILTALSGLSLLFIKAIMKFVEKRRRSSQEKKNIVE